MPAGYAVWGVDIGQTALRAMKLRAVSDEQVELLAYDVVEHPKILSQPDAEPDELIRQAIEKFVSRNDLQGDKFVIGVPGQQTFARFTKLPPVDAKKIPDLVRYEAMQQIPFDIEDVVWDFQVFTHPDSPDVEVGIFAMRKDLVRKHMDAFSAFKITPLAVQTTPSALYNFCRFDRRAVSQDNKATVVVNVGAQNTDLIIAEARSTWTRNIPLGGNSFTEALVKSFKLSFAKAENLKRTAATSKYARQIFQAMRPVFAELVAELQRSLGFYSSTHREVELTQVLACGNAFRLPGLQKYLENNLSIGGGVEKLDQFESLTPGGAVNMQEFSEHALSFGVAYGLALQGLNLATIRANLLPPELARIALWNKKRPAFIAAAACIGLAAACPWLRITMDNSALASNAQYGNQAKSVIQEARRYRSEFQSTQTNTSEKQKNIENLLSLQATKPLIPRIISLVHDSLPPLPAELAQADSPAEFKKLIEEKPGQYARASRPQIYVDSVTIVPSTDIENYVPSGVDALGSGSSGTGRRSSGRGGAELLDAPATDVVETNETLTGEVTGFYVRIVGRSTFGGANPPEANRLFTQTFLPTLRQRGLEPGLGFHMLPEDPKQSDRSNPALLALSPYYTGAPGDQFSGLWREEPAGGPRTVPGSAPPTEATVRLPDPVTGESMEHDWKFEIGFKLKLGDAPAAEQPASE